MMMVTTNRGMILRKLFYKGATADKRLRLTERYGKTLLLYAQNWQVASYRYRTLLTFVYKR